MIIRFKGSEIPTEHEWFSQTKWKHIKNRNYSKNELNNNSDNGIRHDNGLGECIYCEKLQSVHITNYTWPSIVYLHLSVWSAVWYLLSTGLKKSSQLSAFDAPKLFHFTRQLLQKFEATFRNILLTNNLVRSVHHTTTTTSNQQPWEMWLHRIQHECCILVCSTDIIKKYYNSLFLCQGLYFQTNNSNYKKANKRCSVISSKSNLQHLSIPRFQ